MLRGRAADDHAVRRAHAYHHICERARAIGRCLASARGERLAYTFDDSLPGEATRLRVLQRLRREFPGETRERLWGAVDEELTP